MVSETLMCLPSAGDVRSAWTAAIFAHEEIQFFLNNVNVFTPVPSCHCTKESRITLSDGRAGSDGFSMSAIQECERLGLQVSVGARSFTVLIPGQNPI